MGTLEGLAVGVLLGWAFVRALGDEGISSLAVPGRTLAGLAVIAVLAGVVAAVRPSWRASRLDILRAIGTQT
jgi:putative ABC transport system permease protein